MRNPGRRSFPSIVGTGVLAVLAAGVAGGGLLAPRGASAADEEAPLRGTASANGAAAAGAEVAAGILGWAPSAGDSVATAETDAEGRFEMKGAPLGPIDVWVRPRGGAWRFGIRMMHPFVNDLALDASPVRDFGGFDMGGRSGTVTGVVADKQGKAIAGAAVGLRGDDSTWVRTDEKGQFTIAKAGDGDGIVVRAAGYRDAITNAKLDKKRITIKLDAARPTLVHVSDPGGKPLPGAWVVLGDPSEVLSTAGFSSLFPPRPRLVGAWTDEKGDARVAWGHTENKTVATAYCASYAPASKAITAGGAAPVALQVAARHAARATVTLKDGGGPVAGVYLGLPHESDGGPDAISALAPGADRGPIVVGRTDEEGRCLVPDLAADVKTLRVVGEIKLRAAVTLERVADGSGR